MHDDDDVLNQRAAAGDRRAFTMLVGRHEAPLRRFLARVAGADAADDLAQEAFLRAWRNAARFRGEGSYRGWLFSIGWRAFIDSTRRARSEGATRSIWMAAADPVVPADGEARAEAARLLAALDPHERACVILCHGQGWSHSEAAAILGMPLGSLKSRLARAVRRCDAMLNEPPRDTIDG